MISLLIGPRLGWNHGTSWRQGLTLVHTESSPASGYEYESAADSRYVLTFTCEFEKYIEFYWRFANNSNHFSFQQDSGSGDLYFIKVVAGLPTILLWVPGFFVDDEQYEVVIEARGQSHVVTINGELVWARIDPMLVPEPGLQIWDSYVTDDIVLKIYS